MGLQLKVCGMRDTDNINQLLEVEVDYMGFIFYDKSKRYVGNVLSKKLLLNFPKSTKKVGVFVNASQSEIIDAVSNYQLDVVQLHGDESSEFCSLIGSEVPVMKVFSVDDDFNFEVTKPYTTSCDYFLFDTKTPEYGGSGNQFNWEKLEEYDNAIPFFLSGGIDETNIEGIQALQEMNVHAIDINSRFETSPALKDIERIKKFKKQLKQLSDGLFGE